LHFIAKLEMQACNVTSPTAVIFSRIFGIIIPGSQLPKYTKARVNRTKLRIKRPKLVCGWSSAQDPAGGA